VTPSQALSGSDVAVLSQLRSGTGFRTNIGFVDLGGTGALARIRLFDGDGVEIGSELREPVPANGWWQRSRVFNAAGAGDCGGCYALVDLVGGGGSVWAYASVVDNDSGDPTTVPMVDPDTSAGASRYLVAGIAEIEGAEETRWRSNLALLNLAGSTVSADLDYNHGGGIASMSMSLADGELVELENAAADAFGTPDSSGIVDVSASAQLVVTARTFNDAPGGTFGQYLPGQDSGAAFGPGSDGYLTQLRSDADFRTNIGFANFTDAECAVRTFLHDASGLRRGMFFLNVPANGWAQENRVFERFAAPDLGSGYAVVQVLTGGCEVWAYGSVVDNGSGDPTTIPVVVR
jgi:hypothetical protein